VSSSVPLPSLLSLSALPPPALSLFFLYAPPTPYIYTLSLHDALPIFPCQFKIFDHSPGNSISEGLTGADYIYTIMEFFTDHRFDTGGTDIKGDIIMFLQLVCLLASLFSLL